MMRFAWDPGSCFFIDGGFWWMGAAFMIIRLAVLVLVIFLIYKLIKGQSKKTETMKANTNKISPETDEAIKILRERFARGEIEIDEFQRKKAELDA